MKEKIEKTLVGDISSIVLDFTAGIDKEIDKSLIEIDCIGTAAHVLMLSGLKMDPPVLTKEQAKLIIKELFKIISDSKSNKFVITYQDQDVHMAIERRLTEKLGEIGKRVHTARSRNDQVATDIRLFLKHNLIDIIFKTSELGEVLLELADKYYFIPMMGRTHMQPAMLSSLGIFFSCYVESLIEDIETLQHAYMINNRSVLGSAAGFGTAVNVDRHFTAKVLGFDFPIMNVLYASTTRGKCEFIVADALSSIMFTLGKLAEDLIIYSMPEFGYFSLPEEFCTGSSIMPQKKNPDVLELIRARSLRVRQASNTIYSISSVLPSGYHRDLQETKEPVIYSINTTKACLQMLTLLMRKIKVNRDNLTAGIKSEIFAADEAIEMVTKGVPFRQAYNIVKNKGVSVSPANIEKMVEKRFGQKGSAYVDLKLFGEKIKLARIFAIREKKRWDKMVKKLFSALED